jgi:hypothetical protein
MRLLLAEGQQVALPGSTYGYDVLVRIGWLLLVYSQKVGIWLENR